MKDFPFDIIGFDLDGTMLDTSGDIASALNHALTIAGRKPFRLAEVRSMIGGGAGILLKRALAHGEAVSDAELHRLEAELHRYYRSNIAVRTKPYPGFVAALDRLDKMGVRYATITNKAEASTIHLLEELGLLSRMACVIGGDTLGRENAKPSPAMIHEMIKRTGCPRAAFVGDTSYDVGAARNAGIPVVLCRFGYLDAPAATLAADADIDHFDELIPALAKLQGSKLAR